MSSVFARRVLLCCFALSSVLSGCRPPSAVIVLHDPFDVADGATEVRVGADADSASTLDLPDGLEFPADVAVTGADEELKRVFAALVDDTGAVLASGTASVRLHRTRNETADLVLLPACVDDTDCNDGLWCNGQERCIDNICQVGEDPCPRGSHPCVLDNGCLEATQECLPVVDHGLCPAEVIDDIVVEQYCDFVKGCTEGRPCGVDADCDDGLVCNGQEQCQDGRCIDGVPEQFDDGNECTRDVCIEDEAGNTSERHYDVPDGNGCAEVEDGICISGTCVTSVCGDGFIDLGREEECDNGVDNADAPGVCRLRCTLPAHGDGITDPSLLEECDDGNDIDNDACTNTGKRNVCGDGVVDEVTMVDGQRVEECDDGPDDSDFDACKSDCKLNVCGDGKVNPAAEACDDGNLNRSDGCDLCRRTEWVPEIVFGLGEGGGVPAQTAVAAPNALARDRDGNLLWSEITTGVVRRLDRESQRVTLVAGDGSPTFHGDTGPATRAGIGSIVDIAIDGQGNIYLSDLEDHRVRRVDGTSGLITTYVGVGIAGYSGDNGPAIQAQLNSPLGIVVDGLGNLFIADRSNDLVRRVDATTGFITTFAGNDEPIPCQTGDGGPARAARFCNVNDVVLDAAGRLYISDDTAHTVRRVGLDGTVTTVAGSIDEQGSGRSTEWEPATTSPLGNPSEIAVTDDGTRMYLTTKGGRVREVDLVNGLVRSIACDPDLEANFNGDGIPALSAACGDPTGIAIDLDGSVLFSDEKSGRIRRLRRQADDAFVIDTVVGSDDTIGADLFDPAVLFPLMLRLAPGGVAVQLVVPDDPLAPHAGQSLNDELDTAVIVLTDERTGRLFIRVSNASFAHFAGTGDRDAYGDNGPATSAALNRPSASAMSHERLPLRTSNDPIAIDPNLRSAQFPRYVYVADTYNHAIRRIELEGEDRYSNGNITYKQLGDHRITTIVGTGVAGENGDAGPGTSFQLNAPSGITVLSNGHLLIADTKNHRLVEYDPDTQQASTAAGITGSPGDVDGLTHVSGLGNQVLLNAPHALTALPLNLLEDGAVGDVIFFADRNNQKVRVMFYGTFAAGSALEDVPPGVVVAVAGNRDVGYAGDDEAATEATLEYPIAAVPFVDPSCEGDCPPLVLIAEGPDRIREVDLVMGDTFSAPFVGEIRTRLGAKEPQFDGSFDRATMRAPTGFAAVANGLGAWLFVDSTLGTVRTFNFGEEMVETVAGFQKGFEDGEVADLKAQYARLLEDPADVVVHQARREAYVAEAGRHVIRRIYFKELDGTYDFRIAETFMDVLVGTVDAPGDDDGSRTTALLNRPYGLALDEDNNILYVSERGNHTVRRVLLDDTSDQAVHTLAGRPGRRGHFGDDGPAALAQLNDPRGLALGPDGSLYVSDTANHRVRRVPNPVADAPTIEAVLGDSAPASSGVGLGASSFPVDTPVGLTVDDSGNLFVTSRTAVRVVSAGDDGVATGADYVDTIYGGGGATRFPESVTKCIESVQMSPDAQSELFVMDACQGFFIRLTRRHLPFAATTP